MKQNAACAGLFLGCLFTACESPPPHAYIPGLSERELVVFGSQQAHRASAAPNQPSLPSGPLVEGSEVPMLAGPAAQRGRQEPGRRAEGFRPDRITELESRLGYYEVFTPAIMPFKRVSALDAVVLDGATPVLVVRETRRREVAVEGWERTAPDGRPRDRFWGSVMLDFSEGEVVPLPSVSPESRLLSVRTEPAVTLRFEKDSADNFYVRAETRPAKNVRLTYALDAPRTYFGSEPEASMTDSLQDEAPRLPEAVERDALTFARELGLERGMDADAALRTLVGYFRGFREAKRLPHDSGNIFLDLARQKRGVCRHRAYVFMIIAQALGFPTRFVQNEAHAWVEVKLVGRGYVRIDLGGAAEGLSSHVASDRPFYQPAQQDPWPRPSSYEESAARALPLGSDGPSPGRLTQGSAGDRPAHASELRPTLAAAQSAARSRAPRDGRTPVVLRITRYAAEVLRGTSLAVEGAAQEQNGNAVPGLRVEVSLAERDAQRATLLGVAVTDAQGLFRGDYAIPPGIAAKDYALVVVTPGDARYGAARAD